MELKVNRKKILEALGGVGMVAAKNSTLPILECVKISVREDGTMVITAFDLEVSFMRKFKFADSYESPFEFCINPRDLSGLLKTLRDEEITMVIDESICVIKHAKGDASLSILPSIDFPEPAKDANATKIKTDSATLFDWLKNAVKFVANDKLRPMICGVYLYVDGTEFGVAASDGKFLFTDNVRTDIDTPLDANGVLGAKAVSPLLDMLNGSDSVVVSFGEKTISFRNENSMLSCLKPVGAFPKFKMLVAPREGVVKINVDKADLMDSVSRALMTSNVATKLLRLSIGTHALGVSSEDLMFAKKVKEECVCEVDGDRTFDIGVRGDNFLDCLNAIESENVVMEMLDKTKAIFLFDESSPNRRMLCMPLLLNA